MEIKNLLNWLPNPKLLITLFMERNELEKKRKPNPRNSEGKAKFNDIKTPAERTLFFYEYLGCEACGYASGTDLPNRLKLIYKLAYIMANIVYDSSVESGSFPDILDEEKNSMLKQLYKMCEQKLTKNSELKLNELLFDEFAGIGKSTDEKSRPYRKLTYCGETEEFSDKYMLERYLCGAFHSRNDNYVLMPPYTYDIVKSNEKIR